MVAGEHRPESPHIADWNVLFDALTREQVSLGAAISARMIAELPAYKTLSQQELAAGVLVELDRVLESSRRGRVAAGEQELSELAAVGEARAAQGVPAGASAFGLYGSNADGAARWLCASVCSVSGWQARGQHADFSRSRYGALHAGCV